MADLSLLWTEAAPSSERVLADLEHTVPLLRRQPTTRPSLTPRCSVSRRSIAPVYERPGERFSLALEHARRANARHLEDWVLSWICITLHRGTVPVDEAIARATEILERSTSTYVRTSAVGAIGLLRAMKGEFDEARACVEEVRRCSTSSDCARRRPPTRSPSPRWRRSRATTPPPSGSCGPGSRRSQRSGTSTPRRTSPGVSVSRWATGAVRRGRTLRPDRRARGASWLLGRRVVAGGPRSDRSRSRQRGAGAAAGGGCSRADGRRRGERHARRCATRGS